MKSILQQQSLMSELRLPDPVIPDYDEAVRVYDELEACEKEVVEILLAREIAEFKLSKHTDARARLSKKRAADTTDLIVELTTEADEWRECTTMECKLKELCERAYEAHYMSKRVRDFKLSMLTAASPTEAECIRLCGQRLVHEYKLVFQIDSVSHNSLMRQLEQIKGNDAEGQARKLAKARREFQKKLKADLVAKEESIFGGYKSLRILPIHIESEGLRFGVCDTSVKYESMRAAFASDIARLHEERESGVRSIEAAVGEHGCALADMRAAAVREGESARLDSSTVDALDAKVEELYEGVAELTSKIAEKKEKMETVIEPFLRANMAAYDSSVPRWREMVAEQHAMGP